MNCLSPFPDLARRICRELGQAVPTGAGRGTIGPATEAGDGLNAGLLGSDEKKEGHLGVDQSPSALLEGLMFFFFGL